MFLSFSFVIFSIILWTLLFFFVFKTFEKYIKLKNHSRRPNAFTRGEVKEKKNKELYILLEVEDVKEKEQKKKLPHIKSQYYVTKHKI